MATPDVEISVARMHIDWMNMNTKAFRLKTAEFKYAGWGRWVSDQTYSTEEIVNYGNLCNITLVPYSLIGEGTGIYFGSKPKLRPFSQRKHIKQIERLLA